MFGPLDAGPNPYKSSLTQVQSPGLLPQVLVLYDHLQYFMRSVPDL